MSILKYGINPNPTSGFGFCNGEAPMAAKILIISFLITLAAAFFSSRPLRPRGRAAVFLLYIILYLFLLPVFFWLPVYFSVDFSKKVEYPEGFKDRIYFRRDNERRQLPINRDGLIADRDYKPGAGDRKRILILGDSFAAGFGLKYKDTLGARMQKLLGNEYEVINGAFFGTNAEMQVEFFFGHLAKYEPGTIIIRQRMDDVMPLDEKFYEDQTAGVIRKYAPHWPSRVRNAVFRCEILLIRNRFWRYYRENRKRVCKENVRDYYDRLNKYTSARGIRVLLALDNCPRDYKYVCKEAARDAEDFGWVLLKPYEKLDFSAPDMSIPGEGHPSARANILLAEFLRGRLARLP